VIVADECLLHVTTHLVPGETAESRFTEVLEILEALKSEDSDLKCEMVDWEEKPFTLPLPKEGPRRARLDPTEIPVEEPIVQVMLGASSEALGRTLPIGGVRYACDSPYFVNDKRVPTVVFGPGSIEQAHTDDEWIDATQLVEATKVFAVGAMKFLGYR
jgi:acetylornithine deacetylase/succinyl-diaminopimelate desuccinylase-like protein